MNVKNVGNFFLDKNACQSMIQKNVFLARMLEVIFKNEMWYLKYKSFIFDIKPISYKKYLLLFYL